MKIDKNLFSDIIRQNTTFEAINFSGIDGFKLPPREAFIYSNITGAVYLDDLDFPFTPKGLMKIFQSIDSLKMVTGLLDKKGFHFTPQRLAATRPFLLKGDKILIPVEFESELEFRTKLLDLKKLQDHDGQFLVHRIETSKNGGGQEPLLEYLACEYLRNRGFIVDSQIPLQQSFGTPDWFAISIYQLESIAHLSTGLYLFEPSIPIPRIPEILISDAINQLDFEVIAGEAKVDKVHPFLQIEKYFKSKFFSRVVLSSPYPSKAIMMRFDTLSFDENNRLTLDLSQSIRRVDPIALEVLIKFVKLNLKIYYLASLSDNELVDLMDLEIGSLNPLSIVQLAEHIHFHI